jgi:hypothetical protein
MNMAELSDALKGQMQVNGNALVDTMNFWCRPFTTYFLLLKYVLARSPCSKL